MEEAKALGNAAFAGGRWAEAAEAYGRGLGSAYASPAALRPVLLSNRSEALLRLGRWAEALEDAREAVRLDPDLVKAHFRRATAASRVGRMHEAHEALAATLRLQPANGPAKAQAELLRKARRGPVYDLTRLDLPKPQPTGRPMTKVRLVTEEEQGSGGPKPAQDTLAHESQKQKTPEAMEEDVEEPSKTETAIPKTLEKSQPTPKTIPSTELAASTGQDQPPPPPTTPLEFQRCVAELRLRSPRALAAYFLSLPPASLHGLLGEGLDGDLLGELLQGLAEMQGEGLAETELKAKTPELLLELSKLPRFDLAALFLGQREKGHLREVLGALGTGRPKVTECRAVYEKLLERLCGSSELCFGCCST